MKRIGARNDHATKARTAATKSGPLDQVPIAIGQIRAPAVRIGKQLDGRSQMLFHLPPRTQNLFARFAFRHRTEIDVRARVSAKLKSTPVQGAHLIPESSTGG